MSNHKPVEPSRSDYYFNLGLTMSATEAEIKLAFRKLALPHHPDKKGPDEGADATRFREIRAAYDILKNESTRLGYNVSYPQLRAQWSQYRQDYADYEGGGGEQGYGD